MNVDDLTIGEAKILAALFGANASSGPAYIKGLDKMLEEAYNKDWNESLDYNE